MEEIALESLSKRVNQSQLIRLLTQKLDLPFDVPSPFQVCQGIDVPAQRHHLFLKVQEAFLGYLSSPPQIFV